MKLCIVKPETGGEFVLQYAPFIDKDHSGYVRLTEIVDVDFPRLTDDETIQRQLAQIDHKEKEVRMEFQRTLDQLNGDRQNLLALPNHA